MNSDPCLESDPPDAIFRGAFALWIGFVVAGIAGSVTELTVDVPTVVLAGLSLAAVLSGAAVGIALSRRGRGLAVRLGRPWPRRAVTSVSVLLVVVAGLVSLFGTVESRSGLVAVGSALAVAIAGQIVARRAADYYMDAITADEPLEAWRWHWEQARAAILDAVLVLAWGVLAIGNAVSGRMVTAVVWGGFAAYVLVSDVVPARGRQWLPGVPDAPAEIRVHEAGIVTKRPYRRTFVPWESVSHVRLRNDELVVDRGLFDLRFDRDELEDPAAVRAAIERGLENADSRGGTDSPP